MLVALDVQYGETTARAAGLAFHDWGDGEALTTWSEVVHEVRAYESGAFHKRELPCLMAALTVAPVRPDVVIVDGHCWLQEGRPGLGFHLHERLGGVPVIGVAKTPFVDGCALPVLRGESRTPLWVSACGMADAVAAARVVQMHGPNRTPTLLKRIDHLARGL